MPIYSLYCPEGHVTEKVAPMAKMPRRTKCATCKAWAKLGMSFPDGFIRGRVMSDKTRRDFAPVFARGQKLETTRDVDAAFAQFSARYPHLPPPGPQRRDPFPDAHLGDNRSNHSESRIEM
jgi:hypothetical protein